jgi:hypothetical protein
MCLQTADRRHDPTTDPYPMLQACDSHVWKQSYGIHRLTNYTKLRISTPSGVETDLSTLAIIYLQILKVMILRASLTN